MGCFLPEYGGVKDTTEMRVLDSFELGSRRCSGTVGSQECDIGICWAGSRRMRGEEQTVKDQIE